MNPAPPVTKIFTPKTLPAHPHSDDPALPQRGFPRPAEPEGSWRPPFGTLKTFRCYSPSSLQSSPTRQLEINGGVVAQEEAGGGGALVGAGDDDALAQQGV